MYKRKCWGKGKKAKGWLLAAGMLLFSLFVTVMAAWGSSGLLDKTEKAQEIEETSFKEASERVSSGQLSDQTVKEFINQGTLSKEIMAEAETEEDLDPLIAIDPGHGGIDEGCTATGIKEKDVNLQIAMLVKEKLEELGFRVMLTRQEDTYLAKEDRVRLANDAGADAFVSIHQNTFEDAGISGMETWYDGTCLKRDNERLAQLVHMQTLKSTGAQERELRGDADFHVTSMTQMPACLIETGFLSSEQEKNQLLSSEYQEQIAEGIVNGIDLFFHPKTMYLTFDDGPSEECTDMVLNILRERNVKATFFLIGEYVEKYPEVAKRIVEEGHTVGIHCYRHDYGILYESVDSYLEDFQKAYDIVKETTGVETRLFRFPGGSVNAYNKDVCEDIIKEMTRRGYIYFDWNASLEDAAGDYQPEELIANARETALDRKRVVMLAHDRVYNTALCLDRLLSQFPEYKMEVLSPDVEPVQFALP
ncbi:MAG: N-acetylmuramoyl-L-alanine amidase [Bacillota bacterium]|nr:N-acetylmuramoyl-L-alanine amidase [Bacillota bacterium]